MARAHESAPHDGRLDALLLGVLFTRARAAMLVFDAELRLLRANAAARLLPGVPGEPAGGEEGRTGRSAPAARDVGAVADGDELEQLLRHVLASGDPVRGVRMAGDGDRVLSVSAFPMADDEGGALVAVLAHVRDITERRRARSRLELLYAAEARIGALLDVGQVARELAAVVVPALADAAVIDIADSVWRGEESAPSQGVEELALRRAAAAPLAYREQGGVGAQVRYPYASPQSSALTDLRPRLIQDPAHPGPAVVLGGDRQAPVPEPDPAGGPADAQGASTSLPDAADDAHSLILVPLSARGALLGLITLYRSERPTPFDDADLGLATEIAELAAVSVDNARRHTRTTTTASALQRSLLPARLPENSAIEAGLAYVPGTITGTGGAGGDWFDVIALSGARVALVVGDVTSTGLHAAATMGRLRSAIDTMAGLDLPPDELVNHLDGLVSRLMEEPPDPFADPRRTRTAPAATCVYAIHDPIAMRVTMALAGHPPPRRRPAGRRHGGRRGGDRAGAGQWLRQVRKRRTRPSRGQSARALHQRAAARPARGVARPAAPRPRRSGTPGAGPVRRRRTRPAAGAAERRRGAAGGPAPGAATGSGGLRGAAGGSRRPLRRPRSGAPPAHRLGAARTDPAHRADHQ